MSEKPKRRKTRSYWLERWGILPHLPSSFDNANSIYKLLTWLQRGFKALLDDFLTLEAEMQDFKDSLVKHLQNVIPQIIDNWTNSKDFKDKVTNLIKNYYDTVIKPYIDQQINNLKTWVTNQIEDYYNNVIKPYINQQIQNLQTQITNLSNLINQIKQIQQSSIRPPAKQIAVTSSYNVSLSGSIPANGAALRLSMEVAYLSNDVGDYLWFRPNFNGYNVKRNVDLVGWSGKSLRDAGIRQGVLDQIAANRMVFAGYVDRVTMDQVSLVLDYYPDSDVVRCRVFAATNFSGTKTEYDLMSENVQPRILVWEK